MCIRDRRDANLQKFLLGKTKFLLTTYGVLSEGVNLQQFNNLLLNDLPWQSLTIKQAIRRIWRIGQKKACFVIQVLCTPDEVVQKIVTEKEKMVLSVEELLAQGKQEWQMV